MSKDMVRPQSEQFGKDVGLIHEAVITGRKVGATREFWKALAHDEEFFLAAVGFYQSHHKKIADPSRNACPFRVWKTVEWFPFCCGSGEVGLDLVLVTVAELGFSKGVARERIYAKAEELGLDLCPLEVAVWLAAESSRLLTDDRLLVGMEPIYHPDMDLPPYVFYVNNKGVGRSLSSPEGYVGSAVYNPKDYWVFVRPRVV